jgi:nucleoside 2-deoxyribosyltransferase
MKIYLAGGMKSDWQDKVKEAVPDNIFFDPREHGLDDPKEYTKWDLDHVSKSDVVFAVFTLDNPSGFGMCIEIGFAKGLGIPIILVDEKQLKSWAIVRETANITFYDLCEGISYLSIFIEGNNL